MYEEQFDNLYIGESQTSKLSGEHAMREAKMLAYLDMQRRATKDLYRRSLLHPEVYSGAKIPSEIPQETATAQVMWNGQITPNSAGRFLLIIDPSVQAATLYNDETLNGVGAAGAGTTINFDHDSNIIDMYRLVSMSCIISYSGTLDKLSGYIVGATTSNLSAANNNTFFTFTNIENIQNKRLVNPIDGIKLIYSPYDNQQLEYQSIGAYSGSTSAHKWKKLFIIYGEGLPANTCLRWDVVRNIEYISKPALREYIPHVAAPSCSFDSTVLQEVKKQEVTPYKRPNFPTITDRQIDERTNALTLGPGYALFSNQDKIVDWGQGMLDKAFSSVFGGLGKK